MSMTRKAFKYDMQRGLGSCVLELKNTQDIEKFRPLVLWGCSRDMAYDAQCEGCRSFYLYQLITQFPDQRPFIDILEKRLLQSRCSQSWEFMQDCEILSCFVSDGVRRAWDILTKCYHELFQILLEKRKRAKEGVFPERDNFEELCITLVTLRPGMYQRLVKNLGILIEENDLYAAGDFEWFQAASEKLLGQKAVHRILRHPDAQKAIRAYGDSLEKCREERERVGVKQKDTEPRTADEIYKLLKNRENGPAAYRSLPLARRMMNQGRKQEVVKLAERYRNEKDSDIRYRLLCMLANDACAGSLGVEQLIADSRSDYEELSARAFDALSHIKDAKVREYAYELLQRERHPAQAVSLLAVNYEEKDREAFVHAAKQIPVTYKNGEWHGAFSDVMDLFSSPAKRKPRELLPYMYRNTLCSFCREYVVKEMGRRRMLTREMLEEMQYDCNEEIRAYAVRRLGRQTSISCDRVTEFYTDSQKN